MSKKLKPEKSDTSHSHPGFTLVQQRGGFSEYKLKANGLTVLHHEIPGTGVVSTNITYRVGSRDEARGETGLAHMLEHMLFKPTKEDLINKIDSGAMKFERETGAILNANTWKDRTTYYFSYPKELTARALHIESDRMDNVVLSNIEFLPERNNVLSEFDMLYGEPDFALSVAMAGTAFHSHPYGHETIGYREDIERYTTEQLERFYKNNYRPEHAVLMVFGDIVLEDALRLAKKEFITKGSAITEVVPQNTVVEPTQEGLRRVEVVRDSITNLLVLGIKHPGFPSAAWYETAQLLDVLTDEPESILHKKLVDTAKAVRVSSGIEPTSDPNLASITITLAQGVQHKKIEAEVLAIIEKLQAKDVQKLLKKSLEKTKTDLFFSRGSSLSIAMEMTEYVAAGDWTEYFAVESKLASISAASVLKRRDALFTNDNMTIGYFIGNA